MGVLPEGMYRNRSFAGPSVDPGSVPLHVQDILFDPQTAGGLLIAADPACGEELLAALAACVPSARRIGEVCDSSGEARILLR